MPRDANVLIEIIGGHVCYGGFGEHLLNKTIIQYRR